MSCDRFVRSETQRGSSACRGTVAQKKQLQAGVSGSGAGDTRKRRTEIVNGVPGLGVFCKELRPTLEEEHGERELR